MSTVETIPVKPCEWVDCNSTTDYESIKCPNEATHRVTMKDDDNTVGWTYCDTHVARCHAIAAEVQERYGTHKPFEVKSLTEG